MAGRPRLRIGTHGKLTRKQLTPTTWLVKTEYRDADGVTRPVQRQTPAGQKDRHGKLAEGALLEALAQRRPPGGADTTAATLITDLIDRHIDRLEDEGRAIRTIDSYRYDAGRLKTLISGLRVADATAARLDATLRTVKDQHGAVTARRSRTLLRGALQLAVLAEVLTHNPTRDLDNIPSTKRPQGAPAVNPDQIPDILAKLNANTYAAKADLADPVTVLIATGLRRSELLALRWKDFNPTDGTLTVAGRVVRKKGAGLFWVPEAKTAAGLRTVPLPAFAAQTLKRRRKKPFVGSQNTIFASSEGTLRDLDNFNSQWQKVRDDLGLPDVSSHSWRKTIATALDDAGLSARIAADQLGHAKVSMTTDRYMARGRTHQAVADIMQQAAVPGNKP